MEFDLVILNGFIVDGSGNPMYKASIGVVNDKIAFIGKLENFNAKEVIDAEGLVVSPGFIDIHSHGDETLFLYPDALNYLHQGITTIVGGNCGYSPAPLRDWWLLSFWELDLWDKIKPYKYYPEPIVIPLNEFRKHVKKKYNVDIKWRNFCEYFKYLEKIGIGVNYVPLVGHNTIRAQVMGPDYKRAATDKEIKEMKTLLEEAFEDGVWGLSTGLDYEPGAYADRRELVELVKVAAKYSGIYTTHWRRTGIRKERKEYTIPEKIRGIEEAISIAEEAKIKLEISHLLSGYTIYPIPPRELAIAAAKATLRTIDEACRRGVDVAFDVIPNTDGGVFTLKYLADLLAPWIRELGSREALGRMLKVEDFREEVKQIIKSGKWWLINPKVDPYWAMKIKILKHKNGEYNNKTIDEVAKTLNKDPLDVLFNLIIEDYDAQAAYTSLEYEEEVATFIKHPRAMVCTDTFSLDFKWELKTIPNYLPHPNTYGAFPRYLRKYVFESKILSLEEAIKKITYMPASRIGLEKRGLIKEGYYADIVIFDSKTIRDKGDYLEPRRKPEGIKYVIVNGRIVIENGEYKGLRVGRIIKKR